MASRLRLVSLGALSLAGFPTLAGAQPVGSEFRVNTYTMGNQQTYGNRLVSADAAGNFVVVWTSYRQDGHRYGVFGQRYDSGGAPLGSEFQVNSYTTEFQFSPSVAAAADGSFVVAWDSRNQDGSNLGVFGQRYDANGFPLGVEFQVNSYTSDDQYGSSVAQGTDGNFLVVWTSWGVGPASEIRGQRYDRSGAPHGIEFLVNTFTTHAQAGPSVGALGEKLFAVVWQSNLQDGSGLGVFGQRYDFSGTSSITILSPNTNVKWRIGSVQRIQWTHNLGERATFRVELDRDDDGDYEELIAAGAPANSASRGSFAWTVTGPPSGTARARVLWTEDPAVSDASDVTFQIRPEG